MMLLMPDILISIQLFSMTIESGKQYRKLPVLKKDLFITTKIPHDVKTYEDIKQTIDESLKRLQTDYIDLLLIYVSNPWTEVFVHSTKTYYE